MKTLTTLKNKVWFNEEDTDIQAKIKFVGWSVASIGAGLLLGKLIKKHFSWDDLVAYKKESKLTGMGNVKLEVNDGLTSVTKEVYNNFNKMNEDEFFRKYKATKRKYLMRVLKHEDPYGVVMDNMMDIMRDINVA